MRFSSILEREMDREIEDGEGEEKAWLCAFFGIN